jgi:hypothetical protein
MLWDYVECLGASLRTEDGVWRVPADATPAGDWFGRRRGGLEDGRGFTKTARRQGVAETRRGERTGQECENIKGHSDKQRGRNICATTKDSSDVSSSSSFSSSFSSSPSSYPVCYLSSSPTTPPSITTTSCSCSCSCSCPTFWCWQGPGC